MEKYQCSFAQLPFSKLFSTYISDYNQLADFFEYNPFDDKDIKKRAASLSGFKNRAEIVQALSDFHNHLGIDHKQKSQLAKFASPDALVIVTGQQLGVYGGPLYTVYKTLTTILLAEIWEKKLNKPVVPVFWLADEDHDFEEIASIGLPGNDGKIAVQLAQEGKGIPVSDEIIGATFSEFISSTKEQLYDTDFSDFLWNQLNACYAEGKSHAEAFAALILEWFGDRGILIAGSNHDSLKALVGTTLQQSVTDKSAIHNSLEVQSSNLEKDFHRQVVVGDTNLFYLSETGRHKFHLENDTWISGENSFNEGELIKEISDHPERFSPNVFLRPVIQDKLLPTIGYVAGPGELAYYAQMKTYYPHFGLKMPVIFPRISATLLESGIERIMEKLPFELCSYNQRIEDLESKYIELNSSNDIDKIFGKWMGQIRNISNEPIKHIQEIDPTLKGTAGKVVSGFENEIQKLKGRVFRSLKQQEETQLKRISRVKNQIFPDGLQERAISPIYFMNKYGIDLWDRLYEEFKDEILDMRTHHIIKL